MWDKVQETVNYIKDKTNFTPEYGVILGSGLLILDTSKIF